MSVIEFDTKFGRWQINIPDGMSEAERAEVFEDLSKMDRAEKKPLDFGDLNWRACEGGREE